MPGLNACMGSLLLLPTFNVQIATAVPTAVEGLFAPGVQVELPLEEAERDVGVAVLGTLGSGALESDAELANIVMGQRPYGLELELVDDVHRLAEVPARRREAERSAR